MRLTAYCCSLQAGRQDTTVWGSCQANPDRVIVCASQSGPEIGLCVLRLCGNLAGLRNRVTLERCRVSLVYGESTLSSRSGECGWSPSIWYNRGVRSLRHESRIPIYVTIQGAASGIRLLRSRRALSRTASPHGHAQSVASPENTHVRIHSLNTNDRFLPGVLLNPLLVRIISIC